MSKTANKLIIAVDIDDVIAAHAVAFVDYSNQKFDTHLTIEDYQEHWGEVWQVEHDEWEKRADEYHGSGHIATYKDVEGAAPVLKQLSKRFSLVIVTARRTSIDKLTREWIGKYYPGIFDEIYFTGLWGSSNKDDIKKTKAEFLQSIGADFFIDDQLKHVLAAAQVGIESLLFGDYPWNQAEKLPAGATRVKDWQEVLEYFDERG